MPNLALIARALDLIEERLTSPIAVSDMADDVSYSLFHFCRIFNRATHHTPYDYLMRRRLAESARELLRTDRKVIDIALDHQFNSPESFSRAFKRVHGMQPSQFRECGEIDQRGLMPRLTIDHLLQIREGGLSSPDLVKRDPLSLIGMMTRIEPERTAVDVLWELLFEELSRIERGVRAGDYFGLTWYPPDWENRGLLYLAAVELPDSEIDRTALVSKRVPAHQYARFVHKGATGQLSLTMDYIYHTWLPRSGYSLALPLVVEQFGTTYLNGSDSDREIWIPVRHGFPR